jgi:hypothetical protein
MSRMIREGLCVDPDRDGDPRMVAAAIGDIVRARNVSKIARGLDASTLSRDIVDLAFIIRAFSVVCVAHDRQASFLS